MTSALHEERLRCVQEVVLATGARRVLDLGCGEGDLLVRLAGQARLAALVGVDLDAAALDRLRARLVRAGVPEGRVVLRCASMIEPDPGLVGYDCAILIETIEHLAPDRLSQLERALFRMLRPGVVVITTPNADFNPLLGVPAHRFRHPDHRFEWGRARFRAWARRAAGAAGYGVGFADIGGSHPELGGASQMAVFRRAAADGVAAA